MDKAYLLSVAKRFLRAFISGGLASVVLVPVLTGFSVAELKTWALAFVYAFITGGIMALDKAVRYTD